MTPGQRRYLSHLAVSRPARYRNPENLYPNPRIILVTVSRNGPRPLKCDLHRIFSLAHGCTSITPSRTTSRGFIAQHLTKRIWADNPSREVAQGFGWRDTQFAYYQRIGSHGIATKALGCCMGSVGTSQQRLFKTSSPLDQQVYRVKYSECPGKDRQRHFNFLCSTAGHMVSVAHHRWSTPRATPRDRARHSSG